MAALVSGFLVSACGGGGGGGGISVDSRDLSIPAAGIQSVFAGITATKQERREIAGSTQVIGSVTQSTRAGYSVRAKKDANGKVVLRETSIFGSPQPVVEPVVEAFVGDDKAWEGTNLAQPEDVSLFYAALLCANSDCSDTFSDLGFARDFYYMIGFWRHNDGAGFDDFGVFVDGSPHTDTLPTNREAEFQGIGSGYYWRGEDAPAGAYLASASFTANFDGTPTIRGVLSIAGAFDYSGSTPSVNPDFNTPIEFSLAETDISLTDGIYAVSGGSIECGRGCRLGSESENSWGGMFIDISARSTVLPEVFSGTYGISDVQIADTDYDFLGVFISFDLSGEVAPNPGPSPTPDPSPTESVVAQIGKATAVGAALVVPLAISLSQDAQNRLDFSIDNGPANSPLHDIDPISTTVYGTISYVSFGERIYYSERGKIEGDDDSRQSSIYDIYTDRAGNNDDEYWVGGVWYDFPEGASITLSNYDFGALAYYKGLPLYSRSGSGTATFYGQAEGVALDTTRNSRQNYWNYASWKVRLNADFNSETIGGELYDIKGTAANRPLPANITLSAASISAGGFVSGQTGVAGYAAGNWGAQLYGNSQASHAAGTFSIDKSDNSQALAGWFHAGRNAELSISDDEKAVVQFGGSASIGTPSLSYIDYRSDYRNAFRSDFRFNAEDQLVTVDGDPATNADAGFSISSDSSLVDSSGHRVQTNGEGRIFVLDASGNRVRRPVFHVSTGPDGSSLQNISPEVLYETDVELYFGKEYLESVVGRVMPDTNVTLAVFFDTDRTYQEFRDGATDYLVGGSWNSNIADPENAELGAFAAYPALPLLNLPNSGTATYSGVALGSGVGSSGDDTPLFSAEWRVTLNANFNDNSVSGSLSDANHPFAEDGSFPEEIVLGRAQLDNEGKFLVGAVSTSVAGYENGNWGGRFYGDEASHAAGTFGLRKTDNTQRIVGFFHAEKQ